MTFFLILSLGTRSPSSPCWTGTVERTPTLPSLYHTFLRMDRLEYVLKTVEPKLLVTLVFMFFSFLYLSSPDCPTLQGLNQGYPPQNPVYPPVAPVMMSPAQPPQWNGPPPGPYPPGPAAPMV